MSEALSDDLSARLSALTVRDEHRLRSRIAPRSGRGRQRRPAAPLDPADPRFVADLERAEQLLRARQAAVPTVRYPADLPVSQRRDDLLAAIAEHQVVIVAGETGSGKTTQLPKLCLELGRGIRGMIGHTQPRRIAARAVAERVAEELGTEVGETVGFAVRFTDRVSDTSLIKVMTDGILLAEIQRDRLLRNYDTIIIDEAHERSLNIDFLLGYLHQLLPKRPDLKLIITSATIDPVSFARYFGGAPVVEVSGRSYPVEVRYRPVVDPDDPSTQDRDQVTAICDAVTELDSEPPGDVLVFLSGEREIRDTADALTAMRLRDTEILPLYARLSAGEQHRVFGAHRGRRIVLATNVAETSLTVPGIKYVIDAGTARISRYSNRTKVQLLPIEPVSQASAKQRAGRCGRTSDGICIRLYSEADFDERPQFTDPEILRTNLASVILQMAALDLGPVEQFGFIEPPDSRQIADGTALLNELGALTRARGGGLTDVGRRLAQLPVDPRLARMIIEADRRGCVRDVLVLAAALSIQDPRERPAEHQQAADTAHARFADPTSDFAGFLNLWRHVREQQRELSSNQFRRMCRAEYLNYLRIREWQDLFAQLRQIVKSMGIAVGDQAADSEQIHRSLLAGLLSHVGSKEGPRGEYLGARGAHFAVFPGSALFKKQPQFVMAAELVETSRLWARTCASIDPLWAEELGPDLVKRSYSEPHWERRRGAAVAVERVTLYGVPLVVGRKVGLHRIDPELARELFIRHGLVEGDWDTKHRFFRHNRELVADVQELESRARRRDILVDDETVFAFYDARIPASVVTARHFDSWWKKESKRQPALLDLTHDDLVRPGAQDISDAAFPARWTSGSFDLDLSYRFEPGAAADGITVTVPLPLLNEAGSANLEWLVPGLRLELITALLRALPKPIRRTLVPVPDTAAALAAAIPADADHGPGGLTRQLSAQLRALRGVDIAEADWHWEDLPDHLKPTYRVVDDAGDVLAESKDLPSLRRRFAAQVAEQLAAATADLSRDGLTDWDFEELPRTVVRTLAGHRVTGYPALVEQGGTTVAIAVLESEAEQRAEHRAGTRRLLQISIPSPVRQLKAGLDARTRLVMGRSPHGSIDALLADCVTAAIDLLMRRHGASVWTRAAFAELRAAVATELAGTAERVVRSVADVITATQQVELALGSAPPSVAAAVADERQHLARLVFAGFVTATSAPQLAHLPRYLAAIEQRITDAPGNPARDAERRAQVAVAERDLAELRVRLGPEGGLAHREQLAAIGWQIEELRVSLYAQRLGTAHPVSIKRIHAAMDTLDPR